MESSVDFSRIAPFYRVLELLVFGRKLQQRRCTFIAEVASANRVLLLGDGDGRFLAEYIRVNPRAKVDCFDISPGMQRLAQKRLDQQGLTSGGVVWTIADARIYPFEGSYDLIVTHFFLDCFRIAELRALVHRITGLMTAEGRWLLSEFQIPERGYGRQVARGLVWLMYLFFRLVAGLRTRQIPPYQSVLLENGLLQTRNEQAMGGLLVSEIWSAGHARKVGHSQQRQA